jgi:hypothetical protein
MPPFARVLVAASAVVALSIGTTGSSASLLSGILKPPSVPTSPAPVVTPSPTPSPIQSPASSSGTANLRVSGNRIIDTAGTPVVLRGLNRAGTEHLPNERTEVTDAEVGLIASDQPTSWRASAVRVLMDEAQWTGACPSLANDATGYQAAIDREVDALTRRGVLALLDLHLSTAGCRASASHAMPDAPLANDFWRSVAKRYATNPRVAFELYNEPHYVNDKTWLNGTSGATFQNCDPDWGSAKLVACQARAPKYQAAGMQALYDVVVANAPGHLVVVDLPHYATTVPAQLVNDHGHVLVYGVHAYQCVVVSCATTENDHANSGLLQSWLGLAKTHPLLVTEFGWPAGGVDGSAYYDETLKYLESQGWGWLAFAVNGATDGAFPLVSDATTYAPNDEGRVVYRTMRGE